MCPKEISHVKISFDDLIIDIPHLQPNNCRSYSRDPIDIYSSTSRDRRRKTRLRPPRVIRIASRTHIPHFSSCLQSPVPAGHPLSPINHGYNTTLRRDFPFELRLACFIVVCACVCVCGIIPEQCRLTAFFAI